MVGAHDEVKMPNLAFLDHNSFELEQHAPTTTTGPTNLSSVVPDQGRTSSGSIARIDHLTPLRPTTRAGGVRSSFLKICRIRCVACVRRVVDHYSFVTFATFLTIYALIGDDIRLMATSKADDEYFYAITFLCLVVFTIEIVFSSIGKANYICGFFFYLDIVSTASLVLDLPVLINPIMQLLGTGDATSSGPSNHARTGRTARVGAKAGRVVRVIRLVRILKLYKAYYNAKSHRNTSVEDQDDWEDMDDDARADQLDKASQESFVGKTLSELTIRRVIVLVLTMLIVVPILSMPSELDAFTSIQYGAMGVRDAYVAWHSRLPRNASEYRLRYERTLLKYVAYHSWFLRESLKSDIFWIGMISGPDAFEPIPDVVVSSAALNPGAVDSWVTHSGGGGLQSYALNKMGGPWVQQCFVEGMPSTRLAGISLLSDTIDGVSDEKIICPSALRLVEYHCFQTDEISSSDYVWYFFFCFDQRASTKGDATYGLATTVVICLILLIATSFFASDANKLLLTPLEHMMGRVREIGADPLVAMKMADEEFKFEEMRKARLSRSSRQGSGICRCVFYSILECFTAIFCRGRDDCPEAMETVILEKTIIKLGSLLALGFGQAGANIIAQNVGAFHSAGVNVMIPGTKVKCIIGTLRILDFSTATEVLQANVMTFVNQIAEIVHGIVDECHGAPNKLSGETFSLIWRIAGVSGEGITRLADLSVLAFAKIYGAVHRSLTLSEYRGHPGLQQRLGVNCRVNVSAGLHEGWAIEGVVGTELKIDASYLSPNVSISSSIETSTLSYGVPMLVSHTVVDVLSQGMSRTCRLVDNVIIRGSAHPIGLYSFDMDHSHLSIDPPRDGKLLWNSRQRFKVRQTLEQEKSKIIAPEFATDSVLRSCEDLLVMRQPFTPEFLGLFHMGFQNYIQGEWAVAKRVLLDTSRMLRTDDGPSVALLQFMKIYNFKAPSNWAGVRDLPGHPSRML